MRQPAAKRQPAAEPVEILFKPRPDYTEEARRARLEGDVVLEVLFTSSGGLRVLRVVRGLGHGLDQNAIDAAGKIRFRPAAEDGRAVDTVAMVRISFQIALTDGMPPSLRMRFICLATFVAIAQAQTTGENAATEKLLERIALQEQNVVQKLRSRSAVLETYIQELSPDAEAAEPGVRDHYFLGRLELAKGLNYVPLVERSESGKGLRPAFLRSKPSVFLPGGFAQMIMPDGDGFTPANYRFDYVRREFLGEVRCLVFDVSPLDAKAVGKFIGRIWVEDRNMNLVRFNGTYTHSSAAHLYFHFDSWRVNVGPDEWIPAFIYVEESKPSTVAPKFPRFKAQTRLWGYNIPKNGRIEELTSIAIETEKDIKDRAAAAETTPLESQRSWERQAEANIMERLEKSGLLALPGPVDEVLNTVVNNLIASNNLGIEATCRVLLTTPLETFSVGQTIVISRGLLDVLPDEASLATALASELAHIALGHRNDTHFAFYDRTMLPDEELLNRLQMARPAEQIAAAAEKTFAMLSQSPYKDKMGSAGLFLKALASRAPVYPNLIRANLGNQIAGGAGLVRLQSLAEAGPALDEKKLDQIAALPLGSRIRVDPWTNHISLMQAKPVSLLSSRDKLPFEITPFMIPLTRLDAQPAGSR